jgi:hypothetical protein
MIAALDYVLDLMKIGPRFENGRFGRPPGLYVKALALKGALKKLFRLLSLRNWLHLTKSN